MEVALITGAGDGIGREVAKKYSENNYTVIILDKNVRLLESLYDEITEKNKNACILPFDLLNATEKDYFELSENINKQFKKIDYLLHNAAISGSLTPIEQTNVKTWYDVWQVNFHSVFLLTKYCLPLLKKAKKPEIAFTLDKEAEKLQAYWSPYSLSKKALLNFMQTLKKELEITNINVKAVYPNSTDTKLYRSIFPAKKAENTPKEIAEMF